MTADEGPGSLVRAPTWMVFGVPALALTALAWVEFAGLNRSLFHVFNHLSHYTGPGLWAHITILGDGLVCAVLLLPWIRRYPERVWGGILAAVLMLLVLNGLKDLFSLPRPLGLLPEEMVTVIGPGHRRRAFPSGHTTTVFIYVGIWALSTRHRWVSMALVVPAALIGISRIAVGVHWPSDVLAGAALGWILAWVGLRWAQRMPWGIKLPGRRILAVALLVSALFLLFVHDTGYPGVFWFQRILAVGCLGWGGWELSRDTPAPGPISK